MVVAAKSATNSSKTPQVDSNRRNPSRPRTPLLPSEKNNAVSHPPPPPPRKPKPKEISSRYMSPSSSSSSSSSTRHPSPHISHSATSPKPFAPKRRETKEKPERNRRTEGCRDRRFVLRSEEEPWRDASNVEAGAAEDSSLLDAGGLRQVFCSKGGDLELWSEVEMGSYRNGEDGLGERVFRRNLMGRLKDIGDCRVTRMAFGGNKMVLARKDQQSVEVWQSSVRI